MNKYILYKSSAVFHILYFMTLDSLFMTLTCKQERNISEIFLF